MCHKAKITHEHIFMINRVKICIKINKLIVITFFLMFFLSASCNFERNSFLMLT